MGNRARKKELIKQGELEKGRKKVGSIRVTCWEDAGDRSRYYMGSYLRVRTVTDFNMRVTFNYLKSLYCGR